MGRLTHCTERNGICVGCVYERYLQLFLALVWAHFSHPNTVTLPMHRQFVPVHPASVPLAEVISGSRFGSDNKCAGRGLTGCVDMDAVLCRLATCRNATFTTMLTVVLVKCVYMLFNVRSRIRCIIRCWERLNAVNLRVFAGRTCGITQINVVGPMTLRFPHVRDGHPNHIIMHAFDFFTPEHVRHLMSNCDVISDDHARANLWFSICMHTYVHTLNAAVPPGTHWPDQFRTLIGRLIFRVSFFVLVL